METIRAGQVNGIQNTWRTGTVKADSQQPKKHSHSIGPFIGPDQVFIFYEINDENGAIKAQMINAESGQVIREIDVKPPVRMIYGKGSLFESVV